METGVVVMNWYIANNCFADAMKLVIVLLISKDTSEE